jgi:hypothetical protein
VKNRVTPLGEIVDIPQRGAFLGNRGSLHRGHDIVRPWNGRRWITCALEFRGWRAPRWEPGRYTALFFYDEAVALAAGHRPCALCRHDRYVAFQHAWTSAIGGSTSADAMDRRLHVDRLDGNGQRRHRRAWSELPTGAFVLLDGTPAVVRDDAVVPWSVTGYGAPSPRPRRGDATVLTPAASVAVLTAGFRLSTS